MSCFSLLLLAATIGTSARTPPSAVHEAATATVQIRRAVIVDAKSWQPSVANHQREVVDTRTGQPIRIRLTEFE